MPKNLTEDEKEDHGDAGGYEIQMPSRWKVMKTRDKADESSVREKDCYKTCKMETSGSRIIFFLMR